VTDTVDTGFPPAVCGSLSAGSQLPIDAHRTRLIVGFSINALSFHLGAQKLCSFAKSSPMSKRVPKMNRTSSRPVPKFPLNPISIGVDGIFNRPSTAHRQGQGTHHQAGS
jgi:hypothetical protein